MGVTGALQVANLFSEDIRDVISDLKTQGKMRIGVDMYVLLHWAFSKHPEYHKDLTYHPDIKCNKVYQDVKEFLVGFIKEGFQLYLVYDGRTAPFKLAELDRENKRERAREAKKWNEAYNVEPTQAHYMWITMEKCVNELKQEFKELQIFLFQLVAPFEADGQLARLNLENYIDIVLTCDSDLIFYGVDHILFKTREGLKYYSKKYIEEKGDTLDMMIKERQLVVSCLVGNDYTKGVKGYGIKKSMLIAKNVEIPFNEEHKIKWHRYFMNIYDSLDQKIINRCTLASYEKEGYKRHVIKQLGITLSVYWFYPYYDLVERKVIIPNSSEEDLTSINLLNFEEYIKVVKPEQWTLIAEGRINPNTLEYY